jgi:hypothetical protein
VAFFEQQLRNDIISIRNKRQGRVVDAEGVAHKLIATDTLG